MIVKINNQYMTGAVLTTDELPQGFSYFPAFKSATHTFCYVTDGAYIGVPFEEIQASDPVLATLDVMVGADMLNRHGLPGSK